ncbi:uncharacterized protein LOC114326279 [Diabrotica virgifera virgifera]|uniref:Uncharacterized protein n=1 Tax=Diabrotica virgifera virgifera TaxID=50390 RepID=A0ABM5K0H6_DIAVI|nr:uncharacterized protein LOC114326279 [Diabrotica virgifera virgifera]
MDQCRYDSKRMWSTLKEIVNSSNNTSNFSILDGRLNVTKNLNKFYFDSIEGIAQNIPRSSNFSEIQLDIVSKIDPFPIISLGKLHKVTTPIEMITIAKPAPYILKPYAGLYNPFPSNCSLLCNHPTAIEAKELLNDAKDENGNLDVELNIGGEQLTPTNIYIPQVESVPEELFRRYTETDSRPQTPAPTLISGITRLTTSRRCITPDPLPSRQVKEKTQLVLDLRRSHSQENLSIYGSSPFYQDPPQIRIQQVLSRSASLDDEKHVESQKLTALSHKYSTSRRPGTVRKVEKEKGDKSENVRKFVLVLKFISIYRYFLFLALFIQGVQKLYRQTKTGDSSDNFKTIKPNSPSPKMLPKVNNTQNDPSENNDQDEEDSEEFIKRRGKRRRKKGRDASRGPPTFQASLDPETQVATIGPDSHNPSARHSLAPEGASSQDVPCEEIKRSKTPIKFSTSLDIKSFLTTEILKQLRRELNETIVDTELDNKMKVALGEALKTVVKGKPVCEELASLQKELNIQPVNSELWISLPRTFSRSSAIFGLPMDSRTFNTLTPIEYVKDNIYITSPRKLLYNCIVEKYRMENDDENECDRQLHCKQMRSCLDLIMGKPLKDQQFDYFKDLVGWNEEDIFGFKICCGIFALCERIMAPQICRQLPNRKEDPCHEIETADFNLLEKKLNGRTVNENFKTILYAIKNS